MKSFVGVGPGGASRQENVSLGKRLAQKLFNWTGPQWDALYQLWQGESGWDERAKNKSSGAYGIPQALPGDKMASIANDWKYNPATQIIWGLRYIHERYGTPGSALGMWRSRTPHWYATGGIIPGEYNRPVPLVAHAGEMIINQQQQSRLARLLGLGGTGFANGGVVIPVPGLETIGGDGTFGRLLGQLRNFSLKLRRGLQAALTNILASIETFLENLATKVGANMEARTRRLQQMQFGLAGGVASRLMEADNPELVRRQWENEQAHYRDLLAERTQINNALATARRRLKGSTGKARQLLEAEIVKLEQRLNAVNNELSDSVQSQVELQEALYDAIKNSMIQASEFKQRILDVALRVAELLHPYDSGLYISILQRKLAEDRTLLRNLLTLPGISPGVLAQFGLTPAQLGLQSGGMVPAKTRGTPVIVGEGGYDEAVITTDPKYRSRTMRLIMRVLERLGVAKAADGIWISKYIRWQDEGFPPGTTASNYGPNGATRAGYVWLTFPSAPAPPPPPPAPKPSTTQTQATTGTIGDTAVQILEAMERLWQAQLDAILQPVERFVTLQDKYVAIAEKLGNTAEVTRLLNEKLNRLVQEGVALQASLQKAIAAGDTPAHLDILRGAIADNTLAQLDVKDALGQLGDNQQTFTSLAWQWFRQAIFTGNGGLLPQYRVTNDMLVPHLQTGGLITRGGLFRLHVGEFVKPAGHGTGDTNIEVNVTEPTEVVDPSYMAKRIAYELKSFAF